MEINSINYDNKTGQFSIKVINVTPSPAPYHCNQHSSNKIPLSIKIDGRVLGSKIANGNKTTIVDLVIPQGEHEINVYNIGN